MIGDITMPVAVEDKIDYIIHCASITTSKIMISRPVDVIRTSLNGTEICWNLQRKNRSEAWFMFLQWKCMGY